MFTTSNFSKTACAFVSAIAMIGALAYTRGVELLAQIGMVAVGTTALVALVVGALLGLFYLITRQPVVDAAGRLADILKRNPKVVVRFSGVAIAAFSCACWVSSTLPDQKFNSFSVDKALVLCVASLISSICIAKYLRSSPRFAADFKFQSSQWILYPTSWIAVTAVSMLLTMSPK